MRTDLRYGCWQTKPRRCGFVPVAGHGHHEHGSMLDWLEDYYEHKLMLRLRRM